MVFINSFLLQLTEPNKLWDIILKGIDSFTHNFGWTILIFTLIIKIVLSPIDFYNRYSTRKNTLIQKKLAPQVEKINKTFANRKDVANQQINALYKKEGYNMIGSCLFMLINLVLTMVIFFTIFSSLRNMSSYKMVKQYEDLQNVYVTTEGDIEQKQTAVVARYEEIKDGWLWIENIWRPDSNSSPIPSYEQLVSSMKNSKTEYKEYVGAIDESLYNEVNAALVTKYEKRWNGYFILSILALITSFVSQYVIDLGNKVKKNHDKDLQVSVAGEATNTTMKMMKFILPAIMVVFVLTSTAAFGIYIVVSSIISTVLSFGINSIVKKMTQKQEDDYIEYIEKNKNKILRKQEVVKRPTINPGVKL